MRGRIRTVKPEAFDDPGLGALRPLARWYFVGLWTQADRRGRLRYEPGRLRARLLSYDAKTDEEVDALTDVLDAAGLVRRYVADGRSYLEIVRFGWWQRRRKHAVDKRLRERVISRDGLICRLCGNDVDRLDVHIDHVIPVAWGGDESLDNLQVAHSRCNLTKGARYDA